MQLFEATFIDADAGNEKFRGDKRQFAGLLMVASLAATIFPMANLSGLVGPDGTTANEGIPLASLIASVFVILTGISGVITGYLGLIHDFSSKALTTWVLLVVQTAWIPYITDMTNVGKLAATGAAFIPASFNPTENDVWFVGAMGILGILSFGAMFLGSLAFMAFSLYAFQAGKPEARTGVYFRGRLRTYSILTFIAGSAQAFLGGYVLSNFSGGPINPPIGVAMFTVTFPELSLLVGVVYMFNGVWGLGRGLFKQPSNSNSFQMSIALQYVLTVSIMIVTQIAYLPGGMLAPAAPSRAALTLGASLMTAFLDFKGRTVPDELPAGYYGLDSGDMKSTGSGSTQGDVEPVFAAGEVKSSKAMMASRVKMGNAADDSDSDDGDDESEVELRV